MSSGNCWSSSRCSSTDCKLCRRFAKIEWVLRDYIYNYYCISFAYRNGGSWGTAACLRGARALEVSQPGLDDIAGRYLVNAELFLEHSLRRADRIVVPIIGAYYERPMHACPLIHCNCECACWIINSPKKKYIYIYHMQKKVRKTIDRIDRLIDMLESFCQEYFLAIFPYN